MLPPIEGAGGDGHEHDLHDRAVESRDAEERLDYCPVRASGVQLVRARGHDPWAVSLPRWCSDSIFILESTRYFAAITIAAERTTGFLSP